MPLSPKFFHARPSSISYTRVGMVKLGRFQLFGREEMVVELQTVVFLRRHRRDIKLWDLWGYRLDLDQ